MPQMCRFCDINWLGTGKGKVRIFERRGGFWGLGLDWGSGLVGLVG